MSINITDQFIDELYDLSHQDFSESVRRQIKRCLLDYLGATLAGAFLLKDKNEKVLGYLDSGSGNATVIGCNRKTNIESAVFLNGLSSHAAELDDGVRFGMIHPGSPIFSALLPVAETENLSSSDLCKGAIVGYEAAVRLSRSIQPSHYKCGYHPTATCGAIGAALGIAAMLGFSKSQMKATLSAATISASGTLKVLEDGSEMKPFNVGQAASTGLIAATIGRAGFNGPDDPLSGSTGFFSMMSQEFDLSQLNTEKKKPLGIQQVYVKAYAACRHAHPSIEAALKIRFNHKLEIKNISNIQITTYDGVLGKHDHKKIFGTSSAKMSIPFSVAAALKTGKAGIDVFSDENIGDLEIVSLIEKIEISPDKHLTDLAPGKRVAIVEISTTDGLSFTERVENARGEPESPLTDDEIIEKFSLLAAYSNKSQAESQKIIQIVWSLENDLQNLYEAL